jgi:hypothetical protein
LSFVVLALAITLAVSAFMRRWANVENRGAGALLWWLLLTVITSIFLPGGSFLFLWPLLFSLIGLGWMILATDRNKSNSLNLLILSLCAIPGLVLFVPTIYQIFLGLTLTWIPAVIAMVVLLFGLLIPHLSLIAAPFKWGMPGVVAGAAIVLLVAGSLGKHESPGQPLNSIYYALNTDTGKAVWASDLTRRDERAATFFKGGEKARLGDFAYGRTSREYTVSPAPVATFPAPQMSVLEDKMTDGVRAVRLRISSPRQAGTLFVFLDSQAEVLKTLINSKVIEDESSRSESKKPWGLRVDGFPQPGVELELHVRASEPLKFRIVDQSYGLPPLPGFESNSDSQPATANPDFTFLAKSFSL